MAEAPLHRSVSQKNQYDRCPYSYKLARIDQVWQRPAAWLPQGSAEHEAIEAYEKSGQQMSVENGRELFRERYAYHVGTYTEDTPNWDFWAASGPYKGAVDVERRFKLGEDQIRAYIAWREAHPEEKIWRTRDGVLAVELPFEIELGGVPIRGYLDQVVVDESGQLEVRDVKSGKKPDTNIQLGTYKVALEVQYGVNAPVGSYFLGKHGKPTLAYDLSEYTVESVTEEFVELDNN